MASHHSTNVPSRSSVPLFYLGLALSRTIGQIPASSTPSAPHTLSAWASTSTLSIISTDKMPSCKTLEFMYN